ncbi:MAG: sigma-70 family RNA polymerase sigma factor [Syntrophobacteraceae bacterium]|nr:sigma-70 family RNA polymerase sigma factor [Desulfobacteraceae bacterium]
MTDVCRASRDLSDLRDQKAGAPAQSCSRERASMPHSGTAVKNRAEPPDSEIVRRVTGGEVNAFELLVERYRPLVFGIVYRHAPREAADEIAHEVFVRAFQSLKTYSGESPFGHWLARIASRCCFDYFRERHRRFEVPLSRITDEHQKWLDDVLEADSRDAFERAVESSEAKEVLQYALDRLSPADRMVLGLVYLDGMSTAEAADMLGWSRVGVRVRAHRARGLMKKIISGLLRERRGRE